MATEAPSNSKTIEMVVEVGIPNELKKSNNKISVIMTAMKMNMISSNINSPGLNIPLRAISIIPLENMAPNAIPRLANIMIILKDIAFDPKAEFRKFTASLLTPTIKSAMARKTKETIIKKNTSFIFLINYF
tara:strand:- start:494 stop:889 length:396 start_codon:yes stop_codon:yes gene_type:complete